MASEIPSGPEMQTRVVARSLLNTLVERKGCRPGLFELKKRDTGKPYGIIDGKTVGVSITHSRSLLVTALHVNGEIGIDAEACTRKMHPRLHERICHPDERFHLPEDLCCIRLWTIKEAALKYLGTGLRMAMNKIKLNMVQEHLFRAETGGSVLLLYSFKFRDHWIAVALQDERQHSENERQHSENDRQRLHKAHDGL